MKKKQPKAALSLGDGTLRKGWSAEDEAAYHAAEKRENAIIDLYAKAGAPAIEAQRAFNSNLTIDQATARLKVLGYTKRAPVKKEK